MNAAETVAAIFGGDITPTQVDPYGSPEEYAALVAILRDHGWEETANGWANWKTGATVASWADAATAVLAERAS